MSCPFNMLQCFFHAFNLFHTAKTFIYSVTQVIQLLIQSKAEIKAYFSGQIQGSFLLSTKSRTTCHVVFVIHYFVNNYKDWPLLLQYQKTQIHKKSQRKGHRMSSAAFNYCPHPPYALPALLWDGAVKLNCWAHLHKQSNAPPCQRQRGKDQHHDSDNTPMSEPDKFTYCRGKK